MSAMPQDDMFVIPSHQHQIHDRLLNWARWVNPGAVPHVAPGCELAQSNARQWHVPEIREEVDELDALTQEQRVRTLPTEQAQAVRWWYVHHHKVSLARVLRASRMSRTQLGQAVLQARETLKRK